MITPICTASGGYTRSSVTYCGYSNLIKPCHKMDYEANNRRNNKRNNHNIFFAWGGLLRLLLTIFYYTQHDMQKKTYTRGQQHQIRAKHKNEIGFEGAKTYTSCISIMHVCKSKTLSTWEACKDGWAAVDIKNRTNTNKARRTFFRLKLLWRSTIYSRITTWIYTNVLFSPHWYMPQNTGV